MNQEDRCRKLSKSPNEKANELTWEWFQGISSFRIPISWPMIQEAAIQFAVKLNLNLIR